MMPRLTRRASLVLSVLFLVFPLVEIFRVTVGPNFHYVQECQLYRSAQLSGPELLAAAQRFGVRSVINLRGPCPWEDWYQEETAVCAQNGIRHFDLTFSAYLTPAPQELQKLYTILEESPRPLLVHCRRGADRTGLASALAYLHDQEGDADEARRQLSLRFGHFGLGKVASMRQVLNDYFAWLQEQNQEHTRARLRQWIFEVYRPGPCWARLEPMNPPERLLLGQPGVVRFRVYNGSHTPWHFKQGSNVGMHVRGHIEPEGAKPPPGSPPFTAPLERQRLSAGFLNQTVPPGGFIDLDVPYPTLDKPGRYRLYVDIYDEARDCFGSTVGSPAFNQVWETERAQVAHHD